MNETLKAVSLAATGGNVRNRRTDLRGTFGLFPSDRLGGSDPSRAGGLVRVQFGGEAVDADEGEASVREREAVRRVLENEGVADGDLLVIERAGDRSYDVRQTAKRVFKHYL